MTLEPPKLEQIKKWTITNYKYTKQLVGEKLGNTTKTVDKDTDVSKVAKLSNVFVVYEKKLEVHVGVNFRRQTHLSVICEQFNRIGKLNIPTKSLSDCATGSRERGLRK